MTAASACHDTAALLTERFELKAVVEQPLVARAGEAEVGDVQILEGPDAVSRVVLVSLSVGAMTSSMLCAFTAPDSGVPHLALDVIADADGSAIHLDLLPRVDVATHPTYLAHCLEPLTPAADALLGQPGVVQTELPRRQLALMSRWSLTCRVPAAAEVAALAAIDAYRSHWLALAAGLPSQVVGEYAGTELARRDALMRAALFDADLDPVWPMLADLVGSGSAELIRSSLAG